MIDLYVGLVKNGKRTCDVNNKKVRQVPKHLREAVIAELKAQGYDENGKEIKQGINWICNSKSFFIQIFKS